MQTKEFESCLNCRHKHVPLDRKPCSACLYFLCWVPEINEGEGV